MEEVYDSSSTDEDSEDETNTTKVLKKRGRKPKPKTENVNDVITKKKRGRKKKCEMNIDTYKKISGFNEYEDSIDTRNNQIKFSNDYTEPENTDEKQQSETILFGNLVIQKVNSVKLETYKQHDDYLKQTKKSQKSTKCDIDLNFICEPESNDTTNSSSKKDLCDFFGEMITENKVKPKPINTKLDTNIFNLTTNKVSKIKILHCYDNINTTELPTKTDIWCWWCCHQFSGIPRFIPTKYDVMRNRYKITGNFCGWSCARSFMLNDTSYTISNRVSMLDGMIAKIHGRTMRINQAPPRSALKVFGGTMTIDEFRSIDTNVYFEINKVKMMIDEGFYIKQLSK